MRRISGTKYMFGPSQCRNWWCTKYAWVAQFRLPPRCTWDMRSYWVLRNAVMIRYTFWIKVLVPSSRITNFEEVPRITTQRCVISHNRAQLITLVVPGYQIVRIFFSTAYYLWYSMTLHRTVIIFLVLQYKGCKVRLWITTRFVAWILPGTTIIEKLLSLEWWTVPVPSELKL